MYLFELMRNRPDNEAAQWRWLEYAGDLEWELAQREDISGASVLTRRQEIQNEYEGK